MMTYSQHIQRHKELHAALDELLADYLLHFEKLISEINLFELMEWSYTQTQKPVERGLHQ